MAPAEHISTFHRSFAKVVKVEVRCRGWKSIATFSMAGSTVVRRSWA